MSDEIDPRIVLSDRAVWMIELASFIMCELNRGWCWKRKDGAGTPMTFSLALLQDAGGIRKLLSDYEPEKGSPMWKHDHGEAP